MPATHRDDLALIAYAPALLGDDDRPLAIIHAMERSLPGLYLGWKISEEGQRIPLPERDAWVARERQDGGFPLLCGGTEGTYASVTGWEGPASSSSGGQAQLEVHATLPLSAEYIVQASEALQGLAEAARAFWGHVTPFSAGVDIARQTKNWAANPQPPPRGLPALKLPEAIPSPEIPQRLGWVNYWSAAAARSVGFPDPARDAELLSRSRRTSTGGWIVRLTEAPLDLDNPEHLKALMHAYERFPEIGGRFIRR